MRDEKASIDSDSFQTFAQKPIEFVHDLKRNGRHVLLAHNVYRSHVTLQTLMHFLKYYAVEHAQPVHTSGKKQPLDVCVLGVLK